MARVKVSDWVRKQQRDMAVVVKTAVQDLANSASTPTAQGGRMRVDTGFLRNSIAAAVGHPPHGPSIGPRRTADGLVFTDPMGSPSSVSVVLLRWDTKEPLYVGWTASYAKYREAYDGFMEAETSQWRRYVEAARAKVKR